MEKRVVKRNSTVQQGMSLTFSHRSHTYNTITKNPLNQRVFFMSGITLVLISYLTVDRVDNSWHMELHKAIGKHLFNICEER